MRYPRILDVLWYGFWWRLGAEKMWLRLARRWCKLFGHRWEQLVQLDGTPEDTWMCRWCEKVWWPGVGHSGPGGRR